MAGAAPRSTLNLLREDPVAAAPYAVAPAVALVQLLNTAVNGLSPLVSVPFAVVLLGFTALAVGHRVSRARLARLDASEPPGRT